MPQSTNVRNECRFRITQNTGKKFYIEERRSFLGLFDFWKVKKFYTEYYSGIHYFSTLDEAKRFIDIKIEKEEIDKNKELNTIYYP